MSMLRTTLNSIARVPESKHFIQSSRTFWFGRDKVRFPKDDDHATGEERLVRMAIARGNKDPFDLQEQVRGPGTKDNPNIVKTFSGTRMVGCKCEEDSSAIKYMWLHLNEPKRCECGFWFKAVPAEKFWEQK
ncbi:cytochrome c oxidase subunit 5B, mitochondrial [Dermatophagoides farinae]|uniref:Cytochrome C oxidase subunit 5B n=1 Tax=Dermatophagoides farinae TaxID=6954 RepID=A0A922IEK3_DERFA|nr:cytochrome c oxidase subunit 5B, mitochondrial-like [Dermatophagoides farinae]KAH7642496.1 cytochrome c oxidase subunit 5b [Dermatophagoides farinae]KAH9529775.1 Cytochrome c oxidase subunit 5B [Dermatophagoides farinae]